MSAALDLIEFTPIELRSMAPHGRRTSADGRSPLPHCVRKYAPPPQSTGLAQTYAPEFYQAANDNMPSGYNNHLHLVDDSPHGTSPNHSRSAKLILDQFFDLTRGNVARLGAQRFIYDWSDQPYKLLGTMVGDYVYDGNLKHPKGTSSQGFALFRARVKSVIAGKTIYNVYDASGTLVHVDEATDGKKTDYIGKIVRIKTENGTSTPTWLHMDHLGSAQTGTDLLGNVLWREQYTPYGETLTNPLSNNDQAGYTGHIKDSATGLNYMQARYYDPLIGRFLSIDPVGFSVDQPFMFNRYTYVNNDPVNMIDPTGMNPIEDLYNRVVNGEVGSTELSDTAFAAQTEARGNLSNGDTLATGLQPFAGNDYAKASAEAVGAAAFDVKEEVAIAGAALILTVATAGVALEAAAGAGAVNGAVGYGVTSYGTTTTTTGYAAGTFGATTTGGTVSIPVAVQATGTLTRVAGGSAIEQGIAAHAARRTFAQKVGDVVSVLFGG